MAVKEIKTRLKIKSDSAENWHTASSAATPFIPLAGEFIYYSNTGELKIGDGRSTPDALVAIADLAPKTFAKSDRRGGVAYTALKLASSVDSDGDISDTNKLVSEGDAGTPVYFNDGIPSPCTHIDLNAVSATRLANERIFSLSGAVKATPISFNGEDDAEIPISAIKESYISWGIRDTCNTISPIDAALVSNIRADKFSYAATGGITVQYTRNGGSSWSDYNPTTEQLKKLFSTGNAELYIGKATDTYKATINGSSYKLCITIDTQAANICTDIDKFVIQLNTNGSASSTCVVATSSNKTTWTDITPTPVSLTGRPGYSTINLPSTISVGSNTGYQRYLKFTFGANGGESDYKGLFINRIYAFGSSESITAPSNLAATGHIYTLDENQNATFPAKVTAASFEGKATSAVTADKLSTSNLGSSTYPVYFSNGVPTVCNRIPSILAGTVVPSSSLGEDGDIYIMPYASNIPAIYSGTVEPDYSIGVDGDIYILYS